MRRKQMRFKHSKRSVYSNKLIENRAVILENEAEEYLKKNGFLIIPPTINRLVKLSCVFILLSIIFLNTANADTYSECGIYVQNCTDNLIINQNITNNNITNINGTANQTLAEVLANGRTEGNLLITGFGNLGDELGIEDTNGRLICVEDFPNSDTYTYGNRAIKVNNSNGLTNITSELTEVNILTFANHYLQLGVDILGQGEVGLVDTLLDVNIATEDGIGSDNYTYGDIFHINAEGSLGGVAYLLGAIPTFYLGNPISNNFAQFRYNTASRDLLIQTKNSSSRIILNNSVVTGTLTAPNICYQGGINCSSNGGNSSWNQTFADTLYYGLLNPFNYYNSSSVYPNVTDYSLKLLNATALSGSNATNFTNWKTLSLWYNGKSNIIIDKCSSGINRWTITVGATNYLFNPAPNTLFTEINSATSVDDGNWHNIEYDFNGTQARLFIDGILNTVSGNAGMNAFTNNLCPVKIRNTGTLYSASIDELEFDSVVRHWDSNFTPSTYSTNTTNQTALFRFNEGNNVNATFDTGNIFNFTLNGTLTQGLRNWNNGVTKPVILNTRTIEQQDATFATSALQNAKLGKYNDTSKGNIGAGEQLLYEDGGQSISASNADSGTNMFINFHAWGTFNSTALNAKQVRVNLYKTFEGDDYNEELCSTGSHLLNGGAWDLKITETTGSDGFTPTYICVFSSSSALFNNVVYTRSTLIGLDMYPLSLQIYGTGVANNDVTFEGFTTEKWGSVA